MPSVSEKQRRTMAAASHDPAFAKKMGIPVSVAKEFNAADMGSNHRLTAPGGLVQRGSYMAKKRG